MREMQYPDRQSIRLKLFDYSQNGAYFVAVCTHKRKRLFGEIVESDDTRIGIFDRERSRTVTSGITKHHHRVGTFESNVGSPLQNQITCCQDSITLSDIVGWFKTMTTNEYIKGVKQGLYEPFDHKMWQRNYYERVIRNEDELYEMRRYIFENPIRWNLDGEEPF